MADLSAASWTVTVTERWIQDKKRYSRGTLAIAGTDDYVAGGVPLADKSKFGFVRQMDSLSLMAQSGGTTAYLALYDPTNHKVLFYEEEAAAAGGPLLEADGAEVIGPRTYHYVASGW